MKKSALLLGLFFLLTAAGCKKNDGTTSNASEQTVKPVSQTLTGENGEKISIEYFEKDGEVAIKLIKNKEEHILKAKATSDAGNPMFTDGTYVWEMQADAKSGKLTDKSGKTVIYK